MSIETINPFSQSCLLESVVFVYQKTFGGEPWNEGYKCPICGTTTPLCCKIKTCPSCINDGKSILLIEYWPKSKVISDLYIEMSKPESTCLIARKDSKIVGFTWGYMIEVNQKVNEDLEAPSLHEIIHGEVFYLDEVAVLPEYQRKGIGKQLVKEIVNNQRHKTILLRTLKNSQMFFLAQKMGGKTILNISKNRVIMLISI